MSIRGITIKNVRGIDSLSISSVNVFPNKVTFFVAPNGFGKTSIARAFTSLRRGKLEIEEDDVHKGDMAKLPMLEVSDDLGNTYRADGTSNTISETFSVCVINSQVQPKATLQNFGGYANSTPSLVVSPIVLYNTIPSKAEMSYSFSGIRNRFGVGSRKLLINFTQMAKDPHFIKCLAKSKDDIVKLSQQRLSNKINTFLSKIDATTGTKETLIEREFNAATLLDNPVISKIAGKFDSWLNEYSDNEKVVNIIQLREILQDNRNSLSSIVSYYDYLSEKNEVDETLGFLNCTWKNIKATKKGTKFVIEFPKANQISNGERDVLCFVGKLFEAKSKLRKDKSILIIDEIFDYLDDANLIAAQYFLTKFIEQFKSAGKELYVILLTHLDPEYFNTYSFSSKNIIYLSPGGLITNKYKINNILKDRVKCRKDDKPRYDIISKYYLHYHPNPAGIDEHIYLQSLGVAEALYTPASFQNSSFAELKNYIDGGEYDPILVCCGVRLQIEKNVYENLPEEYKSDFLAEYKTTNKLAYAKEKGAEVPEIYFLLSIIYNEAMHLDSQCKKINPIRCKLRNKVIHKMISELQ